MELRNKGMQGKKTQHKKVKEVLSKTKMMGCAPWAQGKKAHLF